MGRSTYLLYDWLARAIPRVTTTWNLDRQDRLLPSASYNLGLLVSNSDELGAARGLRKLGRKLSEEAAGGG